MLCNTNALRRVYSIQNVVVYIGLSTRAGKNRLISYSLNKELPELLSCAVVFLISIETSALGSIKSSVLIYLSRDVTSDRLACLRH